MSDDPLKSIFPDYAAERTATSVFLAVIGWPERLKKFEFWMSENWSDANSSKTEFEHEAFGPRADLVFEIYDVILRIEFPNVSRSKAFIETIGVGITNA
ncbi:MAG: hypothetical protein JJ959_06900 [Nisaea sp.]|uniref:hypothetical protein n=1 Tax=Nisaea sp. TaxID=2024842 RepID=UPI001AFF9C66|nr:hypothetical protein [Nisaea sp.]MBO6560247.1 hypothetical protein [Nisaea sp.]